MTEGTVFGEAISQQSTYFWRPNNYYQTLFEPCTQPRIAPFPTPRKSAVAWWSFKVNFQCKHRNGSMPPDLERGSWLRNDLSLRKKKKRQNSFVFQWAVSSSEIWNQYRLGREIIFSGLRTCQLAPVSTVWIERANRRTTNWATRTENTENLCFAEHHILKHKIYALRIENTFFKDITFWNETTTWARCHLLLVWNEYWCHMFLRVAQSNFWLWGWISQSANKFACSHDLCVSRGRGPFQTISTAFSWCTIRHADIPLLGP